MCKVHVWKERGEDGCLQGIDGESRVQLHHMEDLDVGGLQFCGSGEGQLLGSCEHGNEPSCFIKCWEILDLLRNH